MNFYKLLLVGCGGFFGSVARYLTSLSIDSRLNVIFPYGTLTVNITGSFLLGLIHGILLQKPGDSQNIRLLLLAGFCGGFTTFSSFAFQNLNLVEQKFITASLLYTMLSLIFGILAVWAGVALGKSLG